MLEGGSVENWRGISLIGETGAIMGFIVAPPVRLGHRGRRCFCLGLSVIFGEAVVQGLEAHAEHLGRAPLVAAAVLKGGEDGLALHGRERGADGKFETVVLAR